MNTQKNLGVVAIMLAFLSILPVVQASEEDQATKLTFNKSVQIPGRVLTAGTYWFKVLENIGGSNVVQIFNADGSKLYATVETINAERPNPTEEPAITFADRGSMQPETIVSWFYPGYSSGHEFVYPKPEEDELAGLEHHTIRAGASGKQQVVIIASGK